MILITFIILIILNAISITSYDLNEPKTIKVEIKSQTEIDGIYELPIGSNYNDLFNLIKISEELDISKISKLDVLKNNQIIVLNKKSNTNLISINSANLYELSCLPGIGKSTALKIIEYRDKYGSFIELEDLKFVDGIGDKKYEKIKQYITL